MKRSFLILLALCLCAASAHAAAVATDPSRLTPSARVLGMGRGFVGLADEAAAVYLNPAGIANLKNWEITSMSGQLLEEFNYVSFTGVYPTDWGVLGLGFDSSTIGGCPVTTIEAGTEDDPVYVLDPTQPDVSEYSNVIILSYANRGNRIMPSIPEGLSLGANLKIFLKGMSGDRISDGAGAATGTEIDLAMHYKTPIPWLDVGATLQNALSFNAGGKLYWKGYEESYPAVLETGAVFRILGEENAIRSFRGLKLNLLTDVDYYPTLKKFPMVWHYGVEFYPLPMLALRAGYDQEAMGNGTGTGMTTVSNFTAGVGLHAGGFRFDYAYHAFENAPGITNQFFSLSYAIKPAEIEKPEVPLAVYSPADKLITFHQRYKVTGEVFDRDVRTLKVNNEIVKYGLKGEFEKNVTLPVGKNRIEVVGLDRNMNTMTAEARRVLVLKTFPDVLPNYWVAQPISMLAMQKIITGYPNGTFKPEGNITRAEMCTLLMKTKGVKGGSGYTTFSDVPTSHWALVYIAEAANMGVVKGYPDGTFRPSANITRAEGLAMIARFAGITEEVYTTQFADVPYTHWAATTIAGSYNAGLLEYLKGRPFEPGRLLTRAETVEMLYRTQAVQDILARDLLNWEAY